MTTQPDPDKNVLRPESGLFSREDMESAWEHVFEVDDSLDDLPDDYDEDDEYDEYDDEGRLILDDFSMGWDGGYDYAIEHWTMWMSRELFLVGLLHWFSWRKTRLHWKWNDFRRWLRGIKTDDSDIPF